MDTKALIKEILENGYLMSLATVDDGGPWVSDVIYLHDDDMNIYWMSNHTSRHSQALLKNPHVAGTITASLPKQPGLGIQFSGTAKKIDGPHPELSKKHRTKRDKPLPNDGEDILQGDESWYCITPKVMELIHEPLLGFKKEKLEF